VRVVDGVANLTSDFQLLPAGGSRGKRRSVRYPFRMPRQSHIELAAPVEKAFLVAVDTGDDAGWTAEESLAELASLALTAGAEVVGAEWQNRRHVDPNWYVGKGKAEELLRAKSETGFELLVADDELSPAQQKALESLLNVKVIDRSRLILDIFAQHAQTHEGRLQVELAQLEYQLPRLTRLWTHLSRTGGGIGTRGPGESQLETDRRLIRERIKKMKERVDQVRQQRETAARGRDRRLVPTVGIVGYTNAGKSTLLNALVGSEVAHAEDKLFATLDPTSRQVKLGEGQTAIVTDTVGFIHKLPHQLVDAFRATLEEVNRADILLEVVDGSDPHFAEHRATVQTVLDELGAGAKPRLVAFNKADLVDATARNSDTPAPAIGGAVFVSALTGFGMETLRGEIAAVLASLWVDIDVAVPYAAGELLARVRERGTVEVEYGERDVHVKGRMTPSLAGELQAVSARWAESLAAADGDGVNGNGMSGDGVSTGDGSSGTNGTPPRLKTRVGRRA
jgi:GTP-binding protein HflX